MGAVYAADEMTTGRRVALKLHDPPPIEGNIVGRRNTCG